MNKLIIIIAFLSCSLEECYSQTSVSVEGITVNLSKIEIDSNFIEFSIIISNNSSKDYYIIDSSSIAIGYSSKGDSMIFSFSDLDIFQKSYYNFRLLRLETNQTINYHIKYRRNYFMLKDPNVVDAQPYLPPHKNIYIFLSFIEKKKMRKKYLTIYPNQTRVTTNVILKLGGMMVIFKGN